MARINDITISENETGKRVVAITFDNGEAMMLSYADAGIIKHLMLLEELSCGIHNMVDDMIADGHLDMARGEITREAFEQEIYEDLEDEISCGDYSALCNDGEWIREKVSDLAGYYDLDPDA